MEDVACAHEHEEESPDEDHDLEFTMLDSTFLSADSKKDYFQRSNSCNLKFLVNCSVYNCLRSLAWHIYVRMYVYVHRPASSDLQFTCRIYVIHLVLIDKALQKNINM